MRFEPTPLAGVILVVPDIHKDPRGFFMETYHRPRFAEGGIDVTFVQDNLSESVGGTLRGLHYQVAHPQGKLVQAVAGEIFDVAVDLRRNSPQFGHWYGTRLSMANRHQLYIPPGFAHGFCVLGESAQMSYKCTDIYHPQGERSVRWNDPDLAIDWPLTDPILSSKDQNAPLLADLGPGDFLPYPG